MRSIEYRLIDLGKEHGEQVHTVSLIEFVYNVVSISESGIIPPIDILNERLLSGGKCNPFGNVDWEPFEISSDEYDRLVDDVEAADAAEIWSHKGISFVKLRRASELDHITDAQRWRTAVARKYSDEYVENLIRLNPAVPAGPFADNEQEEALTPASRAGEMHKKPDLERIHQVLLELSNDAIERFASEHKDKRFYAFGFDLNVEYGDVLLCANTEAEFERTAKRYVKDWGYTDAQLADLKKNFGDWRYQGFNLDYEDWTERWRPYSESIERYVMAEDADEEAVARFVKEVIKICSFVLLDLEDSGVLNQLNREPDFYIQCIDHDENEDEAQERLERYRFEYARQE